MEALKRLLEGHKSFDIRSALYYLTRYIKQAESYEDYKKDIFEDSFDSIPSVDIKKLTLSLIDEIENIANKKASKFNDEEFYFWMNLISELENNIDPELTENEIKKALEHISLFKKPDTSSNT